MSAVVRNQGVAAFVALSIKRIEEEILSQKLTGTNRHRVGVLWVFQTTKGWSIVDEADGVLRILMVCIDLDQAIRFALLSSLQLVWRPSCFEAHLADIKELAEHHPYPFALRTLIAMNRRSGDLDDEAFD